MENNYFLDKENVLSFTLAMELLYSSIRELNKVIQEMVPEITNNPEPKEKLAGFDKDQRN